MHYNLRVFAATVCKMTKTNLKRLIGDDFFWIGVSAVSERYVCRGCMVVSLSQCG